MSEVYNPVNAEHVETVASYRRSFAKVCKVQCTLTSQVILDAHRDTVDKSQLVAVLATLQGVKVPTQIK